MSECEKSLKKKNEKGSRHLLPREVSIKIKVSSAERINLFFVVVFVSLPVSLVTKQERLSSKGKH